MTDLVTWLDSLSGLVPTVTGRIVVTAVAFLAVVVILWYLRRRRIKSTAFRPVTELLITFSLAGLAVAITLLVVGVWGLAPIVDRSFEQTGIGRETLGRVALTIAVLVGTYALVGFIKRVIDELVASQDAVTEHQREITYRITQIVLYLTAGIIAIGFWPVDLSGLLIGAGFLGIIVGYAARQTLASVLAGFVLMFSRPFEIGDWIAVDEHEGIVTDITAVNTRIQTFDGEYVIIPNDIVSSKMVTNRSRKGRLRLRVEVGVDYSTDLDHAREVIESAIDDIDVIMSVPTPQVVLTGFGDSAVLFEIKFWIDKPSARRRWRSIQAVVKHVRDAFRREGIKIPFPQRELTGREETGGFRVHGETPERVDRDTVTPPEGGDR